MTNLPRSALPCLLTLAVVQVACQSEGSSASSAGGSSDPGAATTDTSGAAPEESGESGESDGSSGSGTGEPPQPTDPDAPPLECGEPGAFHILDELGDLPRGDEQNAVFCATPPHELQNDRVYNALCSGPFPQVHGLADLLEVLGVELEFGPQSDYPVALAAHSTSISSRFVSAINPRVFIHSYAEFNLATYPDDGIIISYTRGEPYIEIAAKHDPAGSYAGDALHHFNLYLIKFDKECERSSNCLAADFVSDDFDSGWEQISVYDAPSLRNTTLDCLHCHQSEGPGTRTALLFPEDDDKTTNFFPHWFTPEASGELASLYFDDFYAMHPDGFGILPREAIEFTDPNSLWITTYLNFFRSLQPVEFRSGYIIRELENEGESATWNGLLEDFETGKTIPPPHYEFQVEDRDKLAAMTQAYRDYVEGTLPAADLPDIRDVLDPDLFPEMGISIAAGKDAPELLVAACGQCHVSRVAAGVSKGKFLLDDVSSLTRDQKDKAIDRITRDACDAKRMPPYRFRDLTHDQIEVLTEYLTE